MRYFNFVGLIPYHYSSGSNITHGKVRLTQNVPDKPLINNQENKNLWFRVLTGVRLKIS